jgi:hypothetical protein
MPSIIILALSLIIVALSLPLACVPRAERRTDSTNVAAKFLDTAVIPAWYARGCPPRLGHPPVARAIFDVYGGAGGVATQRADSTVRAIERAGGRVLHRFRLDVVRAELDTAAVRALVLGPDPIAQMAEQVVDSNRLNLQVQISYSRPVTDADSAYIANLGGLVTGTPPVRPILFADLPDSILPDVMRAPGVQSVGPRLVGCSRPRA